MVIASEEHESTPAGQPEQTPPAPPAPMREESDQAGNSATAVQTRPAPPATKKDRLPPFRVLRHNDPVNLMQHVVETIVAITPLPQHEAFKRMLEAHQRGVALLLVTHRERAELYQEQFRSRRLTVSIEPAE